MDLEEFTQLKADCKRPENMPVLQVPLVPEAMWARLDRDTRVRDRSFAGGCYRCWGPHDQGHGGAPSIGVG